MQDHFDEQITLNLDKIKIQLISDIHLELRKNLPQNYRIPPFEVTGNVLCLGGDIGNPHEKIYSKFLNQCSERYTWVFVIAGNHEYYHKKIALQDTTLKIREICNSFLNVTFLDNDLVKMSYGESKILHLFGGTFWSNPEPSITHLMNDYRSISLYDNPPCRRRIRVADVRALHGVAVSKLKKAMDDTTGDLIVLSHHLPSFELLKGGHEDVSTAYASDLTNLLHEPIKLWMHGHHHVAHDTFVQGVRVVCNPYGYTIENTGFDHSLVLEI